MNQRIIFVFLSLLLAIGSTTNSFADTYTSTVGDKDFGANRDADDTTTNMDYFVLAPGQLGTYTFPATNDKGKVSWNHILPSDFGFLTGGVIEIRAFDVDPQDIMNISIVLNGQTYSTEKLDPVTVTGTNNGIGVYEWEALVAAGQTANAIDNSNNPLWITSTLTLSQSLIDAINGSNSSTLSFFINNSNSAPWGAVVDYAHISLDYNPVPEPATMLLFGGGILGLVGFRKRRNR